MCKMVKKSAKEKNIKLQRSVEEIGVVILDKVVRAGLCEVDI